MIFDSTMLAALASQMDTLRGERLRDIWQGSGLSPASHIVAPQDNERALYLAFRGVTILIDTHPQRARLHLVERATQGTATPLTAILRKLLRNARLTEIVQPNFDRVLRLNFETRDAIGDIVRYTLVAELMERRSNIILLDESDVIIDALKRLPPFLNRVRTVLPHRPYEAPPSDKKNPLDIEDWRRHILDSALPQDTTATDFLAWLRAHFVGVSPPLSRSLQSQLTRCNDFDLMRAAELCDALFAQVKQAASGDFAPVLCASQPYPFALEGCECTAQDVSFSTLMERCVVAEAASEALRNNRARVSSHLASLRKRNAAQQQDVAKALRHSADAALFQQQGQAILAHMPQVETALQNGATFIELPLDAWSQNNSGETTKIALEPDWSAADNATRCFNRYRRAQKLAADAPNRREELNREAAQLELWEEAARNATNPDELDSLARECGLQNKTVARDDKQSRTKQESAAARPESKLRRVDFEGWTFYMGRNALENQLLLSKVASPSDIWMHVSGRPSAHVLIKNQKGKEPPPRVLEEAARWLAISTRAGVARKSMSTEEQAGERVEIIYTQAKWVRSVRGAPGRVTLQRSQTLLVRV